MDMTRNGDRPEVCIRIAAAGDIHVRELLREEVGESFRRIDGTVDLILLAGDLTTHGEPQEAAILADACRGLATPVIAVLGNHDTHANRIGEMTSVLEDAGITVLERSWTICERQGVEIGIVGTKGFVGGFPGSHLPDFGEPLLREVYAESIADQQAIEDGLREIVHCPVRIVLLHYAPTDETLEGEPPGIWAFLGTDRLAPPIAEHGPDLVLHGHAHAGRFEGAIGDVPVFNVSVPVMGKDFWVFELPARDRRSTPIH
jgi:uncharacterized protein